MKLGQLINYLEFIRECKKVTDETEIFVTASPSEEYDKTSSIVIKILSRSKDGKAKEIIFVDGNDDKWKDMKNINLS
jgi:hypothetical protein